MKPVKLRNGGEEADVLVAATMASVRGLLRSNPVAFYELVMKARDARHRFWSDSIRRDLADLGLVDSEGRVHRSVANVVVSAVTGDGLAMTLGDPRAPGGPT